MKKVWVEPKILVQEFVANEYIAACGEENKIYKFTCDAGTKDNSYRVYLNGDDGIAYTSDDVDWSARSGKLKTYSPCGITHDAKTDSGFYNGYMYRQGRNGNTGEPISVIVWTENGSNTHCTTNLDMDSWVTQKS